MEKFECDSSSKGAKIDNVTFHCDLCDKTFHMHNTQRHYKRVHNWETMHTCVRCYKYFQSFNDLTRHIKDSHKVEDLFSCYDCETHYTLKKNLLKHYRTSDSCKSKLKNMNKTQNERKAATLKEPFEDNHDTELDQSKDQVTPKAKKQRLESERTNIETIEVNTNDQHFQCHICHQSMLKSHLQSHFRTKHNWKNAWKCHQCEQIFEFAKEFSQHLTSFHEIKVFNCDICDAPFTKKYNMERHIEVHFKVSRYKKIGGEESRQSSNGASSIENHNDILDEQMKLKPIISGFVQCPQCDWKSTIYSEIQAHFEIHFLNKTKDMYCFEYESQTEMKIALKKEVKEEPLKASTV